MNNSEAISALDESLDKVELEIKKLRSQIQSKLIEKSCLLKDRLQLMEFEPSSSTDPIKRNFNGKSILVSNLNTYSSEKTLREYFGEFGVVSEIKLEFNGSKNTGSALISYSWISDNDSLFLYEHFVDGSLLKITESEVKTTANQQTLKNHNEKTRSMMISGYFEGLKRAQIVDHFGKYGKIIKYSDTSKPNGKRRDGYKFIFIKYAQYDDADKAIATQSHCIENYTLNVKKAKDL